MAERTALYSAGWHGNSPFFFFFWTVKRKCHKVSLLFTHKIDQSSRGQEVFHRDANVELAQPPTTKQRKCSNVFRLLVSMETPLRKAQGSIITCQRNHWLLIAIEVGAKSWIQIQLVLASEATTCALIHFLGHSVMRATTK